ncbi:unnamed protein product [Dibothriocephalus latus]|uniref:Uncharacterized protein n=1 Tax=Dibothriocephalus latus TaxID=60516 RepID=A0A3P6QA85_DIBLA|nr:unnamed protein product [Dibothriocephalus latus]
MYKPKKQLAILVKPCWSILPTNGPAQLVLSDEENAVMAMSIYNLLHVLAVMYAKQKAVCGQDADGERQTTQVASLADMPEHVAWGEFNRLTGSHSGQR